MIFFGWTTNRCRVRNQLPLKYYSEIYLLCRCVQFKRPVIIADLSEIYLHRNFQVYVLISYSLKHFIKVLYFFAMILCLQILQVNILHKISQNVKKYNSIEFVPYPMYVCMCVHMHVKKPNLKKQSHFTEKSICHMTLIVSEHWVFC